MEMTPTDEITYLKHVIELMQEQLRARDNMITSLLQMQHPVMTSNEELKSIVKGAMSEWADSINIDQAASTQISRAEYPIVSVPEEYISKSSKYKTEILNLEILLDPSNALSLPEIGKAIGIEQPSADGILKNVIQTMVTHKLLKKIVLDKPLNPKYHGATKYLYYLNK